MKFYFRVTIGERVKVFFSEPHKGEALQERLRAMAKERFQDEAVQIENGIINGPYWVTRDQRVIELSAMEDDHLKSIVSMLRRNGWVTSDMAMSAFAYMSSAPDGAYDAVEAEFCNAKFSDRMDAVFEEHQIRFGS